MLDRTVRSGNWIRSDTIFIESTQIEALSNRPAWTAAISEVPMTTGAPGELGIEDGVTMNEQVIAHVLAVGANYWSIWNWHHIGAANVLSYYDKYPQDIDYIARRIGYRIYPAFVWPFERDGGGGLVIGLANDGVAGPPGVVRLTFGDGHGTVVASGCGRSGLSPADRNSPGDAELAREAGLGWFAVASGARSEGHAPSAAVGVQARTRGRWFIGAAPKSARLTPRPLASGVSGCSHSLSDV